MQSKNWHMDVIEMNGVRQRGRQAKIITSTMYLLSYKVISLSKVMGCETILIQQTQIVKCMKSVGNISKVDLSSGPLKECS